MAKVSSKKWFFILDSSSFDFIFCISVNIFKLWNDKS